MTHVNWLDEDRRRDAAQVAIDTARALTGEHWVLVPYDDHPNGHQEAIYRILHDTIAATGAPPNEWWQGVYRDIAGILARAGVQAPGAVS